MYSDKWDWKKQHKLYRKAIGNNAKLIIKRYHDKVGIKKVLKKNNISGIIISGSDYFILRKGSPSVPKIVFKYKIPILAICYGMQYLACKTSRSNINSFKKGMKTYTKKLKMTLPFNVKKLEYTYFHQDYIVGINNKFKIIKRMGNKIVIVYDKKDNILGIQFHPEYILKTGKIFFKNWFKFIKK
jgi:GMP synthase (glutamine-hydrolysing)|tara:strand:- start:290 stop:844 length:555 start_codon:yes stop_codon:yes gene_type:complete